VRIEHNWITPASVDGKLKKELRSTMRKLF